jgi:hypothetical protein
LASVLFFSELAASVLAAGRTIPTNRSSPAVQHGKRPLGIAKESSEPTQCWRDIL